MLEAHEVLFTGRFCDLDDEAERIISTLDTIGYTAASGELRRLLEASLAG